MPTIQTYADDSEQSFPIANVEAIHRLPRIPTEIELRHVSLEAGGWSIRWPALGVRLPVDDVQECIYGSREWMNQLLKKNGQR